MHLKEYYQGNYKMPLSPQQLPTFGSPSASNPPIDHLRAVQLEESHSAMLLTFGKEASQSNPGPLLFSFGNDDNQMQGSLCEAKTQPSILQSRVSKPKRYGLKTVKSVSTMADTGYNAELDRYEQGEEGCLGGCW